MAHLLAQNVKTFVGFFAFDKDYVQVGCQKLLQAVHVNRE